MNRKIKKLAKKTWKEKWHEENVAMYNYMDEVAGACAFCTDASKKRVESEGDMSFRYVVPKICCFCLLPDYICKYEKDGISKNLLNIIHKSIEFGNEENYNKAYKYTRMLVLVLKRTGKIPRHLEQEIKDYIGGYYDGLYRKSKD